MVRQKKRFLRRAEHRTVVDVEKIQLMPQKTAVVTMTKNTQKVQKKEYFSSTIILYVYTSKPPQIFVLHFVIKRSIIFYLLCQNTSCQLYLLCQNTSCQLYLWCQNTSCQLCLRFSFDWDNEQVTLKRQGISIVKMHRCR